MQRWCPKDLRVRAPTAPALTHSLLMPIWVDFILSNYQSMDKLTSRIWDRKCADVTYDRSLKRVPKFGAHFNPHLDAIIQSFKVVEKRRTAHFLDHTRIWNIHAREKYKIRAVFSAIVCFCTSKKVLSGCWKCLEEIYLADLPNTKSTDPKEIIEFWELE